MLSALSPLFPIVVRRKLVGKKLAPGVFLIFFFNLAHYVKHVGGLFASLSVYFV